MSGHSKWATIKRQKGAADNRRGQVFTKLSNTITLAVKQGGGVADPESNFRLRLAVDRARSANMPKENIERAINRAKGVGSENVEEYLYEGFGPGHVAFMVEAVTDNKQRTVSTIKNIFEKNGGVLGSSGSVSYQFARRGEIVAKKDGKSSDDLLAVGINAGVSDMEEDSDTVYYYVDPHALESARKSLVSEGIDIESAQLTYVPVNYVKQENDIEKKVLDLVDKLEESDDVQEVYTNLELNSANVE